VRALSGIGVLVCQPGGMRPSRRCPAAVLAAAALVLAGCAGSPGTVNAASDATSTASPAPAAASTPTGSPSATRPVSAAAGSTEEARAEDTSPFPADTRPDSADPVDARGLTVTAVRAAAHEGFDRVVFELAGQGTPGWDVEYVGSATAEGTGNPIDLAGPAYLRVVLRGTSYPYDSGSTEVSRGTVAAGGTAAVTGVFYDGTFEGQSLAYVGVAAKAPFRVYALTGPARVVVEVASS
jgi:type IV pilus biogenesis protein CpaD/CtpE